MNPRRRQVLLLLSVMLMAALYYAWQGLPPSQVSEVGAERQKISRGNDKVERNGGVEIMPLQSYQDPVRGFNKPQKNLFGAVYQEMPTAPVATAPPSQRTVVKRRNPVAMDSSPLPLPRPVFEVVGYIERGNKPTVFIAGEDGEVHLVQTGTRFADHAVVQYLDRQQVVIAFDAEHEPLVLTIAKPENMRFPSQRQSGGRGAFVAATIDQPVDYDEEDEEEAQVL